MLCNAKAFLAWTSERAGGNVDLRLGVQLLCLFELSGFEMLVAQILEGNGLRHDGHVCVVSSCERARRQVEIVSTPEYYEVSNPKRMVAALM
jgi:hypothetical protein